jgi:hypothetical protein
MQYEENRSLSNNISNLKSVEVYQTEMDKYSETSIIDILAYDNPLAYVDLYEMPPLIFEKEVI